MQILVLKSSMNLKQEHSQSVENMKRMCRSPFRGVPPKNPKRCQGKYENILGCIFSLGTKVRTFVFIWDLGDNECKQIDDTVWR